MRNFTSWTTAFASTQWLFFILANIVVVPISIGHAFDLQSYEIATIMRSSFIVTGLACILQGVIGHRLPIMEGPSGVMWGLVLNVSLSASALGLTLGEIGGGIATGMLLAGTVTMIFSFLGLSSLLEKIFSPMVMSVYLFLLSFHLISIFFNGMIVEKTDGTIDAPVTLFAFSIAIVVGLLKIKGNKTISNFSILIGMVTGWVVYAFFFPTEQPLSSQMASAFSIFPLGKPNLQYGIIAITFLGSIINLSNTVASVRATAQLIQKHVPKKRYHFSYLLTGLYSIFASLFGLITFAPFASSIGFLESTQIFERRPFIIGGILTSFVGIIPPVGLLLATLPISVGSAVLFTAYLQLFGTSLRSLNNYEFDSNTILRLAGPVLFGVSLMAVDPHLFSSLPAIIQPLLSNGFIMGVLLSIGMERFIHWEKIEQHGVH